MLKKRSAFHQVPRALAHTKIQSVASGFPAHREDRFWTYEDPISIRFKASNASHQHLGGVMIWEEKIYSKNVPGNIEFHRRRLSAFREQVSTGNPILTRWAASNIFRKRTSVARIARGAGVSVHS